MMLSLVVAAVTLVAGVGATGCSLANIPVKKDLDEHKVAGVWFEKKFFYSTRYTSPPHYEDFAIIIHPGDPYPYGYNKGLFVTERLRTEGHCETQNEGLRHQVYPAKYKYVKKEIKRKDVDWFIVDTDYHNYLIEFTCLKEYPHGVCAQPEVVVYYRNKKDDSAQKGIHRVHELIGHLCVDPHVNFEVSQKEPGCVEKGYGPFINDYKGYGPFLSDHGKYGGYDYGRYGFGDYGYGRGFGGYGFGRGYGGRGYGGLGGFGGFGLLQQKVPLLVCPYLRALSLSIVTGKKPPVGFNPKFCPYLRALSRSIGPGYGYGYGYGYDKYGYGKYDGKYYQKYDDKKDHKPKYDDKKDYPKTYKPPTYPRRA